MPTTNHRWSQHQPVVLPQRCSSIWLVCELGTINTKEKTSCSDQGWTFKLSLCLHFQFRCNYNQRVFVLCWPFAQRFHSDETIKGSKLWAAPHFDLSDNAFNALGNFVKECFPRTLEFYCMMEAQHSVTCHVSPNTLDYPELRQIWVKLLTNFPTLTGA